MDKNKETRLKDEPANTILVDDRERAGGLAAALERLLGGRVACARLAVGDVRIGGRLVIERKEAADFVASMLDGRLARQARELSQAGGRAVIVIEGEFNKSSLAGMAGDEVREAILALALDRGLAVLRSRDVADTARWIAALARREEAGRGMFGPTLKPVEAPRPHPAGHRAPRKKKADPFLINPQPAIANPQLKNPQSAICNPQSNSPRSALRAPHLNNPQSAIHNPQSNAAPLAALRRVEGLGPARARALLERFGTMRQLLAASEAELAETPGIGPALARAIREALRLG